MATFTELLRDTPQPFLPWKPQDGPASLLVENSFSSWSLSLSWLSLQVSARECTRSCQCYHSFPSLPGQLCSLTLKAHVHTVIRSLA